MANQSAGHALIIKNPIATGTPYNNPTKKVPIIVAIKVPEIPNISADIKKGRGIK